MIFPGPEKIFLMMFRSFRAATIRCEHVRSVCRARNESRDAVHKSAWSRTEHHGIMQNLVTTGFLSYPISAQETTPIRRSLC